MGKDFDGSKEHGDDLDNHEMISKGNDRVAVWWGNSMSLERARLGAL